jgi:hypothetical protein
MSAFQGLTINISGPIGINYGSLAQNSTAIWYRDMNWTPMSSQSGLYLISVTATDNINQISSFSFNLSVSDTVKSPDLISFSGSPSKLLTNNFLAGINGSMTFKVSFTTPVQRPTTTAYIRIFSSSGYEIIKYNCNSSGFVTYLNDTLYINVPVNTFIPSQSYYVLFDEGVGLGSSFCRVYSSSPVTSKTFWTFTVPSNSSSICISAVLDTTKYTACNSASLTFLLGFSFSLFISLHSIFLIFFFNYFRMPEEVDVVESNSCCSKFLVCPKLFVERVSSKPTEEPPLYSARTETSLERSDFNLVESSSFNRKLLVFPIKKRKTSLTNNRVIPEPTIEPEDRVEETILDQHVSNYQSTNW